MISTSTPPGPLTVIVGTDMVAVVEVSGEIVSDGVGDACVDTDVSDDCAEDISVSELSVSDGTGDGDSLSSGIDGGCGGSGNCVSVIVGDDVCTNGGDGGEIVSYGIEARGNTSGSLLALFTGMSDRCVVYKGL